MRLSRARAEVAKALDVHPAEVFFVSSGSEANNWIIGALIEAAIRKGERPRIITTAIEHDSILEMAKSPVGRRAEWVIVPVPPTGDGLIEACEDALGDGAALMSVMLANHETGQRLPVEALAERARAHGVPFHSDVSAALGRIPLDRKTLGVDAMSISGHKLGGPAGVGALIVRRGLKIDPMMVGGPQERRRRAGSENLAGIIGLGAAMEALEPETEGGMLGALSAEFLSRILENVPDTLVNTPENSVPGILNLSFAGVEGQSLLMNLDLAGICISSGAPCASGSLDPSPVLLAQGASEERARSSVRISFGWSSSRKDMERGVDALIEVVRRLRRVRSRRSL